MEPRQWLNRTQPQTLQNAELLLYLNAGLTLLDAVLNGGISLVGLLLGVGAVAAGFGSANERRWGYYLGLVVAGLLTLFAVLDLTFAGLFGLLNLAFAGLLLYLLLAPASREYRRIWFH